MVEERVQRRLAAILAADVVGYSRLIEQDEAGTRARLRTLHAEVIDPRIAEDGGRIVKSMGDGILVEFPSAVAAVENALSIQNAVAEHEADQPEEKCIQFRIGINVGDVIIEGDDIHGEGVNLAARLEGLCTPGQVYASGTVYDQAEGKLRANFEDLGEQTVKNIARPVRTYRVHSGRQKTGKKQTLTTPGTPSTRDKPSIAVLPFANLGNDAARDYLADGLRLAIQASLVHMPGLFLIAPPAVQRYRDQEINVRHVARELGVRFVMEGAAQWVDDRVRVTVQLTDTNAGQVIWAERYDRPVSDTLATQDEITAEVVHALGIKLLGGTTARHTLSSVDAVHAFYRGLNHFYARTKDDNVAAIREFETVVSLQPDSPVGPAYLCMSHWNDASMGWSASRNQSLMHAVEWAEKAVKFKETNGMAHIVLACIHLLNGRYDEALSTCNKAVELRPNCPMANGNLANVLHYCGQSAEAVSSIEEAIRILPLGAPWFLTLLADACREIGHVDRSISVAKQVIEKFPRNIDARLILCSDYELSGMHAEADSVAGEIISTDPTFSVAKYLKNQPYRHKNKVTESRFVESLRKAGLPD